MKVVPTFSRAQQVVADCRRRIASGRWKPGQQLPPERELAERYGVARTVVREAMCALLTLGLIRTRQGGGIYVQENIGPALGVGTGFLTEPHELRDLMAVRAALEPLAAALAAQNHQPADIAALKQNVDAMRHAQTLERKVAIGVAFHGAMARASGNVVLSGLISNLLVSFASSHELTLSIDVGVADGIFDHEEILAAISAKKADLAERLVADHLARTAEILEGLITGQTPPQRKARGRSKTLSHEIIADDERSSDKLGEE
jgi:GntR family transcriptional repressor for pyruvate dehydrogenase complex